MSLGLATKIYAVILLVIFGGIVLHAPFSVWIGTLLPDFDLLIKAWKEILMIPAAALAKWLVWRRGIWRELARDRIMQLTALYIALHGLVAAAMLTGLQATLAGLAIDLRFVIFFALVYVLMKLAPEYKNRFIQVGAAGAVVVVGFGVMQLFLPADILTHIGYGDSTIKPYMTVDENPDYIRINSTLRGPNPLGAYIVIIISLLVAAALRARLDLRQPKVAFKFGLAGLASLVVLWVTYSRSAVAAAGLAAMLVAAVGARHLVSRKVWITGSVVLFALAGGVFLGRDSSFVTNVILHENRDGGSAVTSNQAHVDSLRVGVGRMLEQPVGAGVGSTGSASLMTDSPLIIENQYLFVAHEVGWFGLVLFLAIFSTILYKLWQQRQDWLSLGVFASGIGLGLIGVLLPVWVDDTVSIVWWGLAAVVIGSWSAKKSKLKAKKGAGNVRKKSQQKAKRAT